MAYTTIKKSTEHFNTKLYTGNGSTQSITGVGFQPDFVWLKQRSSGVYYHRLQDSIRGAGKPIYSNRTDAEGDFGTGTTGSIRTFDTDGFSIGSDTGSNENNTTMVSWNWKANGTGSSNTDGSITSTVSANTTNGFSIVSYTGNETAGATVGHGLSSTPKMIILKNRNSTDDWVVYHESLGNTQSIRLNLINASATTPASFNNTSPTSSVFTLGDWTAVNGSSMIAYCFADVKGFSKFGSYTGNGNADGTFVYTGFKPAFIMVKPSSIGNEAWKLYDNKRNIFNVVENGLNASDSQVEGSGSGNYIDFLSNGFKLRTNDTRQNGSGATNIYMAFAEEPLVGDNPATAR
jgi:hypothetical protein